MEFGEIRIWFWVGSHGDSEAENDEIFFGGTWDEEKWRNERYTRKKEQRL